MISTLLVFLVVWASLFAVLSAYLALMMVWEGLSRLWAKIRPWTTERKSLGSTHIYEPNHVVRLNDPEVFRRLRMSEKALH